MKEFIIPFEGLKEGKHYYDFEIDRAFFESIEDSLILDGKVNVSLEFEKTSTMLILNFNMSGIIDTECDRCGDFLQIPVKGEQRVIVKFGEETFDETEEILILPQHEHELNLMIPIYEMIILSLPHRKVHEDEKDCNPAVIKKLREFEKAQKEEELDPRWAVLNKLKNEEK